jgi:hypothetical protein
MAHTSRQINLEIQWVIITSKLRSKVMTIINREVPDSEDCVELVLNQEKRTTSLVKVIAIMQTSLLPILVPVTLESHHLNNPINLTTSTRTSAA